LVGRAVRIIRRLRPPRQHPVLAMLRAWNHPNGRPRSSVRWIASAPLIPTQCWRALAENRAFRRCTYARPGA